MHGDPDDRSPCRRCGYSPTERASDSHDDYGGVDPCLGPGLLPGVSAACCGHGGACEPYVRLGGEPGVPRDEVENQVTLFGAAALEFFRLVKAAQGGTRGELWL